MVEKILDLVFLLLVLLCVVSQMALPGWPASPALRLGVTSVLLVALVGLLTWQRQAVASLVGKLAGCLPGSWSDWLVQKIGLALKSLDVFQQPKPLAGVIAWSIIAWLLAVSTNLLVFAAMGLQLSIWTGLLLLVVLQVGLVGFVFAHYPPGPLIEGQGQTPCPESGLVFQDSSNFLGFTGGRSTKLAASGFSSVYVGGQHSKIIAFSAKSPHTGHLLHLWRTLFG